MSRVSLAVTDARRGRTTTLTATTATRVEEAKTMLCKVWEEWQYADLVLLTDDEQEMCDGRTLGEVGEGAATLNAKVVTRSSLADAAQQARVDAGKADDGDEEEWGIFGDDADQKVGIKVAKLEGGRTTGQFTWRDEGHTLGNSLRHVLIQNPAVLQCGYTIPHPLENKMVMEVTSKAYPPDVLQQGLHTLADNLELAAKEFERAFEDFQASQMEVED